MNKLSHNDLYSLEQYDQQRPDFRGKIMDHKKNRRLAVGPNTTLYFEDRLTMQYQVQEMLRAEKIFTAKEIQEELDTYNPLIPDGSNWKATFMIEFSDVELRKKELSQMIHIEDKVWIQVQSFDKIWSIADEDIERGTDEKTSSVHFLRFELTSEMKAAVKQGKTILAGIGHDNYSYEVNPIPGNIQASLMSDLD